MVFSSHLFLYYFLPLTLAVYYGLYVLGTGRPRLRRNLTHGALAALSYAFYGWSNPAFMGLMLFSTLVDYAAGRIIESQIETSREGPSGRAAGRRARWAVAASVLTNLGLLAFFKYFHLGVDTYNALVEALGVPEGAPLGAIDTALRVTLPLGISFYTFQSISYTIDVYRGRTRALTSFLDFACYVSLFPQLVAGPILRFHEVADQLAGRSHTVEKVARGTVFFCLGMAKKVLVANPCGWVADQAFGAGSPAAADAWFGLAAYSFQIYFDFSGYSDMAIGLGLMLGFVFPKNFDSPYHSASLTEFWRRWHISLSTWLRDYLYIPLGGNRKGRWRTYVNLGLVMLLGGLWHGASWNFALWGGLHGVWLAAERWWGERRGSERPEGKPEAPGRGWIRPLRIALTFTGVSLLWVFFRAPDFPSALRYLEALFGLGEPGAGAGLVSAVIYAPYYVLALAAAAVLVWTAPQTWDWSRRLGAWKIATALGLLILAAVAMASQGYNPFIYFIF